jgi:hypothetical protein
MFILLDKMISLLKNRIHRSERLWFSDEAEDDSDKREWDVTKGFIPCA